MREARIAQLILSLATTPDRAASTVGDLLEGADTRGSLWFWSSVLRTAGSLCWRDFCSAPLRMIWLGFWGFLAAFFYGTAPMAALGLLVFLAVRIGPNPNPPTNPLWVWPLLIASEIFGAVFAGWEVARSSKGRELAAAFSVTFMVAAFYALTVYLSALQFRRIGRPYPSRELALAQDCLEVFCVFLGAVLCRLASTSRRPSRTAN
jgi:hypothetical protein